MRYENKAAIKAMLLEILAECDQTFSDVLINRVSPIVKQAVKNEFNEKRNELLMEVAVTLGKIMQGRSTPAFDMPIDPSAYTSHMMGR